jgi:hypothetical protein
MKYAVVYGRDANDRALPEIIARYLPDNYEVIHSTLTTTPDNWQRVGIRGEDAAGWTMDDYVIPRLRSGNFAVEKCRDLEHVRDRTQGVMN